MEVTMISRGVEISIAGGVAETEDGPPNLPYYIEYRITIPRIPTTKVWENAGTCAEEKI